MFTNYLLNDIIHSFVNISIILEIYYCVILKLTWSNLLLFLFIS